MARTLIFFLAAAPLLAVTVFGEPALQTMLHEPIWLAAAFRTLLIAEVSVPVALLLAVPAAIGVHGASRGPRRWLTGLCALPILMPQAWVAAGFRDAASRAQFHGAHIAALVAAHTAPAAAVAFLVLHWALERNDWRLREMQVAQGAGWFRATWLAARRFLPEALALSAAAAFAVSAGLTLPDAALAPALHPTLGKLLMAAQHADDAAMAAAALLLAMLCVAPLGLVFCVRLLAPKEF